MSRRRLAALAALAFAAGAAGPAPIEPKALNDRIAWADRSLVVLDVRTAAEFSEGHIPGAINIPREELADRYGEAPALIGPETRLSYRLAEIDVVFEQQHAHGAMLARRSATGCRSPRRGGRRR